jgi:hypothetical protein
MAEKYIPFEENDDKPTALAMFKEEMRIRKARQQSISEEELEEAISTTINILRTGPGTGGGRRIRQFVWSIWNGWHLINLFDLSHGLDRKLTDAVIVLFRAAMFDVLTDAQKRRILTDSGEFARWEACRDATPEEETALYPPPPLPAEDLMRLATSAQRSKQRFEEERRRELSESES